MAYRVDAKTPMAGFTWGDFISIAISEHGADASIVSIGSTNKPFFGSARADKADRRNTQKILTLASIILEEYGEEWRSTMPAPSPTVSQAQATASKSTEPISFRMLIISVFDWICLAIVIVPTLIAVLVFLVMARGGDTFQTLVGAIYVVLTFIGSAFIAGGALTLLDIANNVRILARSTTSFDQTIGSRTSATDQLSSTQS
jgi:hypothetical protein